MLIKNESSSKETNRKKLSVDFKAIDRPPTPIDERTEAGHNGTGKATNDEQTIPAERGGTRATKRRSVSGGSSSTTSSHKMETASSDDMLSEEGSEFGELDTLRDHQRRLPQIRRDMALILNLKVFFLLFKLDFFLIIDRVN